MSAKTPCLACGKPSDAPRCPTHRAAQRARYNANWERDALRAILAHIAEHGNICFGWRVPAHESRDLTLDHERGVLCRACNTRKRRLDGE